MNRKKARILITSFTIICIAILAAINLIPRGNFIGAPFITLAIYIPLGIIQLYVLVQIWIAEEHARRIIKFSFYTSLIITLIFIYLLYDYLSGTS